MHNFETESQFVSEAGELKNRFLTIKIKEQLYLGKPATAIYINDYSKKMSEKLYRMQR